MNFLVKTLSLRCSILGLMIIGSVLTIINHLESFNNQNQELRKISSRDRSLDSINYFEIDQILQNTGKSDHLPGLGDRSNLMGGIMKRKSKSKRMVRLKSDMNDDESESRTHPINQINKRQAPVTVTATVTVVSVLNFDQPAGSSPRTGAPPTSTSMSLAPTSSATQPVTSSVGLGGAAQAPISSSSLPISTTSPNSINTPTTPPLSSLPTQRPSSPLSSLSEQPLTRSPFQSGSDRNNLTENSSNSSDRLAIPSIIISTIVALLILILCSITYIKLKSSNFFNKYYNSKGSNNDLPPQSSISLAPYNNTRNNGINGGINDEFLDKKEGDGGCVDEKKRFKNPNQGENNNATYSSIGKLFSNNNRNSQIPIRLPSRALDLRSKQLKIQKVDKDTEGTMNSRARLFIDQRFKPNNNDQTQTRNQDGVKNEGEKDGPTEYQRKMARKHKRLTGLLSYTSAASKNNNNSNNTDQSIDGVNNNLDFHNNYNQSSSYLVDSPQAALDGKLWLPQTSLGQGLRGPK